MSIYGKTFKFRIFKQTVIFTIDPVLVKVRSIGLHFFLSVRNKFSLFSKAVYIEKNLPKSETFRSVMGYPGGER